jgi:hypothetical protein
MTDDLLTPLEYARYRRCSVRTLDRERADGVGCPYIRLGSRVLYRRPDIDRYLDAHVRAGENRVGKPTGDREGVAKEPKPGTGARRGTSSHTTGADSAEAPRSRGKHRATEAAP